MPNCIWGNVRQRQRGQDYAEAATWLRKAAEQGHARAQFNLGCMYDRGQGVPKDDCEAARLFKLSADKGNSHGQNNLGFFYSQGRGDLPKDEHEAARLYKLAADQGNCLGAGCAHKTRPAATAGRRARTKESRRR